MRDVWSLFGLVKLPVREKETLVDFVSSNCVQEGCVISLVSFVQPFSTVCFHMAPQLVYPRGCIVTLVTFVWLFPTVRF